jgi:hypothetical protein
MTEWCLARGGRDVADGGSGSGSDTGRLSIAEAPREGDTTRPSSASPCHSCTPPANEMHGHAMLVVSAGHQVDPQSSTARLASTRSPRACPASGAHPSPWGAVGEEMRGHQISGKKSMMIWPAH